MTASLGAALIGTGFIGKAHAMAYRAAHAVLGDTPPVRLAALCDVPAARAEATAAQFGFARATDDWRTLIDDKNVDIISITTPNHLHAEITLAALAAGKHVWCEKPLALNMADASRMAEAAAQSDKTTIVGYNYLHNPAVSHAKRLIEEGRIGRLAHVRGWADSDYQADPDLPWTWRASRAEAGLGILGDFGCHALSLMMALAGPVESLTADMQIIHKDRPLPDGSGRAPVENEDMATALLRFKNGVHGSMSTSRSAWGRKNHLSIEAHGTKGMILFTQERLNELRLFVNEGEKSEQGFRTILTGVEHPPYGEFLPSNGHQLGFLDLKTIEAAEFLRAIAEGRKAKPSIEDALEIERVFHAIAQSAENGRTPVTI